VLQVSPHDCTGCELCVHVCPDDALTATPILDVLAPEAAKWDFMQSLPNRGALFDKSTVRGSQFQQPLMEFSGACEGCGETPYVKRECALPCSAAWRCYLLLYLRSG
jgi:pyruvate-ferredoxin/flavodoxin oxidoreductase